MLEKSNELVEQVEAVGRRVQEEVHKAEIAWSNAEKLAVRPLIAELTTATIMANEQKIIESVILRSPMDPVVLRH